MGSGHHLDAGVNNSIVLIIVVIDPSDLYVVSLHLKSPCLEY